MVDPAPPKGLPTPIAREAPTARSRFEAAVEAMLDGFSILSAVRDGLGRIVDFRYEYINEAGCRLNHRTREEQVGHTLLELLPGHRSALFERWVQLVETGKPLTLLDQVRSDTYGGGKHLTRTFDVRAVKLGDGFAATWRDVSARIHEEEMRRASEARFQAIFDQSPEGILLTSPDGRIHAANPAACQLLGRTEAEICTGGRDSLVDVTDPRLGPALEARARTGRLRAELRMMRGDGAGFPAEVVSKVFLDREGEERTVLLFRDLTHQKALEAQSRLLATIVASAEDAIVSRAKDGTVISWNQGAERLFGYAEAEVVGRRFLGNIPPSRLGEFEDLTARIQEGNSLHDVETERLCKDGRVIQVALDASPLVGEEGLIIGSAGIMRDIGPRKQAEAERERLILELRKALADIRTLRGLVPICASCKKIRDDQGFWTQVEKYIQDHTHAQFSHGVCPECARELFPDFELGTGPEGS